MKSGDTVRGGLITSLTSLRQLQHALSFPIVIFATIFFSTVFRFVNFLSLASAACNSARNSCVLRVHPRAPGSDGRHIVVIAHLDLAPREELGILAALAAHVASSGHRR